MKIKGWEKISGYTYKGFSIVNPIHNANETKYIADVLDLNQSHKPKLELNILTPAHKWKATNDTMFHILLWDEDKFSSRREVSRELISSVSAFREVFEGLIDDIIKIKKENEFKGNISQVTKRINGGSSGIINVVNNNGTTIDYGKMMEELVKAIKEQKSVSDDFKKALTDAINDL